VAAALGVLHFLWLVKADVRRPVTYGLVVVGLLGWRLMTRRLSRARPSSAKAAAWTPRSPLHPSALLREAERQQ
jgi:DMSO/TMAO reductase YedYZ heme-binding membrane subunit